jgi:hypothetical protein
MEDKQRKKIEDKLREMILLAKQVRKKDVLSAPPPQGARVIRRRKGNPDMQIA